MKENVRALRAALGLTQANLAERAGLESFEVTKLESGVLQGQTVRVQRGLARAAGVSLDDMNAFLEGEMPLDILLTRRGLGRSVAETDPLPERGAAVQFAERAGYPPQLLERARRETPAVRLTADQWLDRLRGWRADLEAEGHGAAPRQRKRRA